jgi:ABC-type transport system involved in multi-copper enzyme maturation permease subunit
MLDTSPLSIARLIARQSALFIFRERTVALLSGLFVALVLISAYLGWSATRTVNSIYADAVVYLTAAGVPIPPNPVTTISPLSLLRNMSIYVSLIGALAAIVVGYQLIAMDRKSGVMPLLGTRPFGQGAYALGKVSAMVMVIGALMAVAALISVGTFLILPEFTLSLAGWGRLMAFFALSIGYMIIFGFLGVAAAAFARSESVALLLPMTIWLTVTFILPSLTANIHPTAAINPISALAPAPDSAFFDWSGWLVGPFSIAESFKYLSAQALEFLPPTAAVTSAISPFSDLLLAFAITACTAVRAMSRMDHTKGDYNV